MNDHDLAIKSKVPTPQKTFVNTTAGIKINYSVYQSVLPAYDLFLLQYLLHHACLTRSPPYYKHWSKAGDDPFFCCQSNPRHKCKGFRKIFELEFFVERIVFFFPHNN